MKVSFRSSVNVGEAGIDDKCLKSRTEAPSCPLSTVHRGLHLTKSSSGVELRKTSFVTSFNNNIRATGFIKRRKL